MIKKPFDIRSIRPRFPHRVFVILKHEELKITLLNKLEIVDEVGHVTVSKWVM